jgi:hypothetical protein
VPDAQLFNGEHALCCFVCLQYLRNFSLEPIFSNENICRSSICMKQSELLRVKNRKGHSVLPAQSSAGMLSCLLLPALSSLTQWTLGILFLTILKASYSKTLSQDSLIFSNSFIFFLCYPQNYPCSYENPNGYISSSIYLS